MHLKLPLPVRNLLIATDFWQKNGFILREFRHFPRIAILALVFSFLAAAFEGFGVGFILSFLQNLTNPEAQPIQTGINWVDIWILGVDAPIAERLYRVSALILLTTWLRSAFTYWSRVYSELAQINLSDRIRKQIFEQLQSLNLSFFAKKRSSELINSITSEVYQLQQAFGVVSFYINKGSILLAYVVSMALLSWQLTVLSLILFSLLTAGISTLLGQVREASFERTRASNRFIGVVMEFVSGIRTVQAFATHEFERKRFHDASLDIVKSVEKSVSVNALVEPLSEGAATSILIGMLVLAFTILIPKGQLGTASLLTFLFVLFRIMPIMRQMNGARAQISNFQGALANVRELLRTDDKPYLIDGHIAFSGLRRAIELVSVDFGYSPEQLVLQNVTLTINRGEMTALIGASGAGKTTLADLIPRFYDPALGMVLIDGVDLRDFKINTMRRKLAVVSQDTFIFNTSVRNNIAYGIEGADEAAIWEAARQANALEFIQEMSEGLDTQLGDRGVRLSGGQRQRIAIARALLRNPEILILDEATSALDSVSERLIQESIEKLSVGRTVLAIAHRLSTISQANRVVVMEQGRIVEQGGYQELLAKRGELWKYHQMQYGIGPVG
ncbi:heterocyst formation ABC transporter subunit HepA [Leptolyngbya sp. FACHB-261]|uniref:heterocyst formation ABC transporter subunit HepA n=1 Tax=Leptolyngbya sp. FACHB-261 TaxID=2692806 RepID=UPI001682D9C6|nr:heterocyst formation ABC transporter subunit HepA [Leptolyngbya sp. FACHB-261]MBD2101138.1 ABC transporter ATP-binding protein [Leptolyngbya sp. FACHB-261]